MNVLYCDNHLLVVEKPAGRPTVPDESGDESLFDQARAWVRREYAKPGEAFLGIVHRLDRPVSGLVVFARTSKAAARLSQAFRTRAVEKRYWGVTPLAPGPEGGLVEQWLIKDERARRVHASLEHEPRARCARTRWRELERAPSRRLLELCPETGRPHQLRAAAASLGTPLLGDLKYGARGPLPDGSVALHARYLCLDHPTHEACLVAESTPPELPIWDFELACAARARGSSARLEECPPEARPPEAPTEGG